MKILNSNILFIFCFSFTGIVNADYGDWEAKIIDVYGNPSTHYVNDRSNEIDYSSIYFDNGHMGDLSVGKDVSSVNTEGGTLNFKINKDVEIVWGGGDADERKGLPNKDWKDQAWPWVVQVKIRQSKQKSKWTMEARYLQHGKHKAVKLEQTVIGNKNQVIQFDMGAAKKDYSEFRLSSETSDNDIVIDWIKVVRPSIKKVFRYEFNLQEEPVDSKFLFSANGKTTVSLNGVRLGVHGARHPYSRMLNMYENVNGINKGVNKLCVTVEGYSAFSTIMNPGRQFFFLEGIVIDSAGNKVKVKTDSTWKGGYSDEGCSDQNVKLKEVVVRGGVKTAWPVLTAMKPHERFGDRPYLGRIKLNYGQGNKPIFSYDKNIVLVSNVTGSTHLSDGDHFIRYQLKSWSDDKRQAEKTITDGVVSHINGIINLQKIKPGVYELFLAYVENGKTIDELRQELVVVGKIDQNYVNGETYKQGMSLKQTDSIKFDTKIKRNILCGKPGGKDSNFLNKKIGVTSVVSNLVEGHLRDDGLELPVQRAAWCSIKFNTGQLYKPHLVEVEYPDDSTRSMLFVVTEDSRFPNINNIGGRGGIPRLTSGVYTNGEGAASTATKRFIYWPNKKDATLTVVNSGRNYINRGAIKSLTVSEIESDLPAFSIPETDESNFFIGPFVERIDRTTPRLFYGGSLEAKFSHELMKWGNFSGYYNAWYTTISNLIKYLRFSGQNTYYAGIYMYSGGWFASQRYQGHSESGVDYFGAAWDDGALDLMAMMFEANGLNLVLGVQFIGSKNLSKVDEVSDKELINGKESIRFVDKDGRQVHGFQNQGYNFFSSKVSDEILGLAEEVGNKFGKYAAVKGVTWMRQPEFPLAPINNLGITPLDIGYGDTTISLYKQQTDTLLPTSLDYSKRFGFRYKWIMENEKEKWLQWRSKKTYEFDKKIETILLKHRNDWKMWRIVPRPVPELVKKRSIGEINLLDVYRYSGINPELYAKSDQLNLMLINDIGAEKKYELRRKLEPFSKGASNFYSDIGKSYELENFAMLAHVGFILETKLHTDKTWPWQHLNVVGYSLPSSEGLYFKLTQLSGKHGREAIAIGWSDSGHFAGYEQDIRNYRREMRLH